MGRGNIRQLTMIFWRDQVSTSLLKLTMTDWHLYMIRVKSGALYTGIALDVDKRFQEHQAGGVKAAKYLRGKGPLELVYRKKIGNRSEALKTEAAVKKLSKYEKEKMVGGA